MPACSTCNNGASSEDEDLRFFISAQVGKQTPDSAALWDDGAHKSIKRKTKLRKALLATVRDVEMADDQGNRVNRLAFEAPVRTYQAVFERITRGLYFFHTGRILPSVTSIIVTMLSSAPDLSTPEIKSLVRHSIGGDAFIYRFGIAEMQSDSSVWLYEFYKAHWVMTATGNAVERAS